MNLPGKNKKEAEEEKILTFFWKKESKIKKTNGKYICSALTNLRQIKRHRVPQRK